MKKDKNIHILKYKDFVVGDNEITVELCHDYALIDNELKTMQSIVGGYIERVVLCSFFNGGKRYSIDLVCNDEGLVYELPYKAVIVFDVASNSYNMIAGNYFLALADESTGEYIDMPKDIIDKLEQCFTCVELVNGDIVPCFFLELLSKHIN